jgi:hypothetical protein
MLNHTHVASRPPTDQASIAAILAADRADIFQETTRVQASRRDAPVTTLPGGRFGRARVSTRPIPIGSPDPTKMIGTLAV